MTLSRRGNNTPPQTPLEHLELARRDSRGFPFLSNDVYNRAKHVLEVLPSSMPDPIVRALADGSLMLYWNRTNIPGFDQYEELELWIEVMPSCKIQYDWTVKPKEDRPLLKGTGFGIIRSESHPINLLDTSARYAMEAFAPLAIIPQRGVKVKDLRE